MNDEAAEVVSWRVLPGGAGSTLAVAGQVTAASSLSELTVWQGDRPVRVAAHRPSPGRPRIVAEPLGTVRVWWGTHVVDADTGAVTSLDELRAATTVPTRPAIGGRAGTDGRVTNYAWSPDGALVLVATQDRGGSHTLAASAVLMSRTGNVVAPLWQSSDVAPGAGWVDRRFVVVGTRPSIVFDLEGNRIAELPGALAPIRIDAGADDRSLLVVAHDRLSRFDTRTWTATTAPGRWLDATLAPAGDQIAAITMSGDVCLLDRNLEVRRTLSPPGPPTGIALGPDRIVVAVAGALHIAVWPPTGAR